MALNNSISIGGAVYSVSTPGVSNIADPEESARVARAMNEYSAKFCAKTPGARAFFATVPSPEYTELALREIRHAFDALHAAGVTLFTCYGTGNGYLGHEQYVPVWEELNARKAVVFVHPCDNKNSQPFNES